ncbi:MAG: hypothetical protein K1X72_19490 [Pyrinomonadaceae bacterium]|nr:hypothetical protein [Pyrinomonadaceae bacterium]
MEIYKVGGRVKKICTVCNEHLDHLIKSITKQGAISRVICSQCGSNGVYRSHAMVTKLENLSTKTGDLYDQSRTYRSGQFMRHPIFGQGEVITVLDAKKIDVLFMDRMRRLVHSRL